MEREIEIICRNMEKENECILRRGCIYMIGWELSLTTQIEVYYEVYNVVGSFISNCPVQGAPPWVPLLVSC